MKKSIIGLGISLFISTNSIATITNDPYFLEQWSHNNTGQTGGITDADIDLPEAWQIETGNKDIMVAIIDSGININHEDLKDRIWTNTAEIPNNGIDDDNNGFIDDINGWNFQNNSSDVSDYMGHGTLVTGIIAAVPNNNKGIAGIAQNVTIMPIRIQQKENPDETQLSNAITYAVDNGADIINMSLAGRNYSAKVKTAVDYAHQNGVLMVASAANYGTNNDTSAAYPASYGSPSIISVAATDHSDGLGNFGFVAGSSCYGATSVHVAAPGVDLRTTGVLFGMNANNSYTTISGTSLSAPIVSGIATLMLSLDPSLTPEQIKQILIETSDEVSELSGLVQANGRVNAYKALSYVSQNIETEEGEGETEEGQVEEGQVEEGQVEEGQTEEGQTEEGQTEEGQTEEGQT
ncbi:MAG: hypothetical protein D6B27_09450, partial [Gammaproteobacteria bacterium]